MQRCSARKKENHTNKLRTQHTISSGFNYSICDQINTFNGGAEKELAEHGLSYHFLPEDNTNCGSERILVGHDWTPRRQSRNDFFNAKQSD